MRFGWRAPRWQDNSAKSGCSATPDARGRSDVARRCKDTHSNESLERLRRDAAVLVTEFGLGMRSLDAERPQVRRRYGICYADGRIRIRLRHAATGRPLKYSSLVNTLCHELAHLRHFNHGPRFRAFYAQVLERARSLGLYRPGREEPPAAEETPGALPDHRSGLARRASRFAQRTLAPDRAVQLNLFGEGS